MTKVWEFCCQDRLYLFWVSGDEDSLGTCQAELGKRPFPGRQAVQLACAPIDKSVVILILANLIVQLRSCVMIGKRLTADNNGKEGEKRDDKVRVN